MDSNFLIDIFVYVSNNIPIYFGIPLLFIIRQYFKEIRILIFISLWILSMFTYLLIISIVNP